MTAPQQTGISTLQLIAAIVGQLGFIAQDPALGYRGQALTQTLALLATVIAKGDAARAELEQLAAEVQGMVNAGREPTKDEWQSLRDKSRAFHEILNSPPPPPPPEEAEPKEAEPVEGTDDK